MTTGSVTSRETLLSADEHVLPGDVAKYKNPPTTKKNIAQSGLEVDDIIDDEDDSFLPGSARLADEQKLLRSSGNSSKFLFENNENDLVSSLVYKIFTIFLFIGLVSWIVFDNIEDLKVSVLKPFMDSVGQSELYDAALMYFAGNPIDNSNSYKNDVSAINEVLEKSDFVKSKECKMIASEYIEIAIENAKLESRREMQRLSVENEEMRKKLENDILELQEQLNGQEINNMEMHKLHESYVSNDHEQNANRTLQNESKKNIFSGANWASPKFGTTITLLENGKNADGDTDQMDKEGHRKGTWGFSIQNLLKGKFVVDKRRLHNRQFSNSEFQNENKSNDVGTLMAPIFEGGLEPGDCFPFDKDHAVIQMEFPIPIFVDQIVLQHLDAMSRIPLEFSAPKKVIIETGTRLNIMSEDRLDPMSSFASFLSSLIVGPEAFEYNELSNADRFEWRQEFDSSSLEFDLDWEDNDFGSDLGLQILKFYNSEKRIKVDALKLIFSGGNKNDLPESCLYRIKVYGDQNFLSN